MRHPKNPFSPDEPDDGAFDRPCDRHELAADAAPGRGGGTPPPLPRRKGDSGFRPRGGQAPPQQDFWPLADPEDSWPLAPRPPAEPAGYWSPGDPEDSWAAPAPAQGGLHDDGGQEAGPEEAWAASRPAECGPPASWDQGGGLEFWSPDSRPHGAPRDPWRPPPTREDLRGEDLRGAVRGAEPPPRRARGRGDHSAPGPTGRGDLPPGGDHFFPAAARFTGRLQEGARPPEDFRPPEDSRRPEDRRPPESSRPAEDRRPPESSRPPEDLLPPQDDFSWEDEQRWEYEPPCSERVPAAAAGPAPDQKGDPAPASMGFQDLWESWQPPYDPIGAISEPVRHPTAPYPELVRDTEYEDDLGLWETPAEAGPGGGPHYPDDPGPRRRAQHARNVGRPRLNSAFLALAAALAIAGAIPLGILGVRTLAHHGNPALKTAPLSAGHAAASAPGPNGGTSTALAGPGCPVAANASTSPYHAPNGDGWRAGTSAGGGPCGSSFMYSYLAMVPGNPGEWHDHYAWVFRTGMHNPSCTFSLYIPAAPQANSTDYYWFSAGDSNAVNRIADFTIDQAAHQGQWVTKGPFTFLDGTVLIEATDRGEGAPTASVAVGPVRLSC